jgi:murein DD-endopeptidase MepM/ murein hydrolase activator NlpD
MQTAGPPSAPPLRPARSHYRVIVARGDRVRAFSVRPWVAGIAVFVAVAFGAAYLAATSYLFLRDDIVAASAGGTAEMRRAYEDRIAALRSNIEELSSRRAIDQRNYEAKIARLLDRQAALDARQDVIAALSQAMRRAGLVGAGTARPAASPAAPSPSAADDAGARKPEITGSIAPAATPVALALRSTEPPAGPADTRIAAVESSLDGLARDQVAFVDSIAGKASQKSTRIASILERLGHPVPQAKLSRASGVGGPFVPLSANADPKTFQSAVELVMAEVENLATLRRAASSLPLARPIANAPVTSRFGARLDPFLGKPAMHTGVDFRAPSGYPIRATAGGTVLTAEWTGGYGNMVEIDHGNGLTTRYAHLSRILVHPGEVLSRGAVVGRAGSTGRSTGPHVHYEIRIDGEAIDPMRYIRAGSEIGLLL